MKAIKKTSLSAFTKVFLISEVMYEILLNTVHLDSPFSIYLPDSGVKGAYTARYGSFERCLGNYKTNTRPRHFPERMEDAVIEAVINLSISYRIEKNIAIGGGGFYLTYFLANLLALKIHLVKGETIVPPFIENLTRYLEDSGADIGFVSKIYKDRSIINNYIEISKIINKLNDKIDTIKIS